MTNNNSDCTSLNVVSELITKLEAERNELQEQLERADEKEAEVTKQVFYLLLIVELCTVQYSKVQYSTHII